MAASMKKVVNMRNLNIIRKNFASRQSKLFQNESLNYFAPRARQFNSSVPRTFSRRALYASGLAAAAGCGLTAYGLNLWHRVQPVVNADSPQNKTPQFEPIRKVRFHCLLLCQS